MRRTAFVRVRIATQAAYIATRTQDAAEIICVGNQALHEMPLEMKPWCENLSGQLWRRVQASMLLKHRRRLDTEGGVTTRAAQPEPRSVALLLISALLPAGIAAVALLVPATRLLPSASGAAAVECVPLGVVAAFIILTGAVIGGRQLLCMWGRRRGQAG